MPAAGLSIDWCDMKTEAKSSLRSLSIFARRDDHEGTLVVNEMVLTDNYSNAFVNYIICSRSQKKICYMEANLAMNSSERRPNSPRVASTCEGIV